MHSDGDFFEDVGGNELVVDEADARRSEINWPDTNETR